MIETISAIALLLAAAIVALVVWALVPLLLRILRQWGIFDRPNERSSHSAATPKGGGLVVVPAVLGAWVILFLWTPDTATGIFPVIAGAALLAIVSWLDDLKDLPVAVRLLVQAGAVGLALWGMAPTLPLLNGVVPLAVEISVLALAWVWFINLFNFMDGIDGITAAETVSICLGLSLVALLQGWELADFGLPLLLLGGLAGFWPWNRSPAKLFLGDVGSVPVGFMVGWLLLSAMEKGQWAVALILPLYYLMDSSLTLAKRLLRGERIWRAHREHFYQRAVQGGESHAKVVWLISICNLILICLSLISLSGYDVLCAFAALVIVGLILMKLNSPKTDAQR